MSETTRVELSDEDVRRIVAAVEAAMVRAIEKARSDIEDFDVDNLRAENTALYRRAVETDSVLAAC